MHISEGVLSPPVIASGWVCTVALLILSLRKTSHTLLPAMAIFSSIFFLASLIRVPIGATSVHFSLIGLLGIILGWGAFPAIFISLTLQAVLFQFGGILALGVNSIVMGLPALIISWTFGKAMVKPSFTTKIFAGISGFGAIILATILLYFVLLSSNENFKELGIVLFSANIGLALLEGIITMFAISFLQHVAPDILCPIRTDVYNEN